MLIYRIDPEFAREQAQWFVVGLVLFAGTILVVHDHHVLERYRYTIAAVGIALLVMPRLPGIGEQIHGAFLAIKLGPIQFQPAEFAKLAIIVFLASYLRETGDILVRARLRPLPASTQLLLYGLPAVGTVLAILVLGLGTAGSVLLVVFVASLVAVLRERPSPKHFGPLLLVWGLAMLMLIFIRDLGSSLMFFGGFLVLLYVATSRLSLVGVGATMFFGGAFFLARNVSHVQERVDIWIDPFKRGVVDDEGYQIAQSLFAQADGGLFGQGFGEALIEFRGHAAAAGGPHRPDLLGARERGGAVRRGRRARRVPAVRLPWLQDGDDRQRRLLEAARRRADGGVRAAGVRDRRGRHARDPAHRRNASVRLLRG